MSWSERYLDDLASETGFRRETLEKVLRLGELLTDISAHPLLSSARALKGGTALNLGFGAPSRLSVDLDFNYIGSIDRARMLEERPSQALRSLGPLDAESSLRCRETIEDC